MKLPDALEKLTKLEAGEYAIEKGLTLPGYPVPATVCSRLGSRVIVEGGRAFHRVGIKLVPGQGQSRTRWLVIEHGTTRVYFTDEGVLITDREVNP